MRKCHHHYQWYNGKLKCARCGHRKWLTHGSKRKIRNASICAVLVVIGFFVYQNIGLFTNTVNNTPIGKEIPNLTKQVSTFIVTAPPQIVKTVNNLHNSISQIPTTEEPTIIPTPATQNPIETPSLSLAELRQIALDDINKYRKENGVRPVSLGNAQASQLYAVVLVNEGCIHHISDNGDDPMMRYKRAGDQLFLVAENLAGGSGTDYMTPHKSILDANYRMMYEDADQGNGHRDNILNANHISVSLGIAYDSQRLVLVEDFEEPYSPNYSYTYASGKSCW